MLFYCRLEFPNLSFWFFFCHWKIKFNVQKISSDYQQLNGRLLSQNFHQFCKNTLLFGRKRLQFHAKNKPACDWLIFIRKGYTIQCFSFLFDITNLNNSGIQGNICFWEGLFIPLNMNIQTYVFKLALPYKSIFKQTTPLNNDFF